MDLAARRFVGVGWMALFTVGDLSAAGLDRTPARNRAMNSTPILGGTERYWSGVRIEQVDDDGQVHFVSLPDDDRATAELLARSAS
jgi:hypothetical protein